jgi:hypothetical protein
MESLKMTRTQIEGHAEKKRVRMIAQGKGRPSQPSPQFAHRVSGSGEMLDWHRPFLEITTADHHY